MKKALLIGAVATILSSLALVSSTPVLANETIAQASTQMDPQLKATMEKLRDQLSKMPSTGSVDKDSQELMEMLISSLRAVMNEEMKVGKSPKMEETTKEVYDRLFQSNPIDKAINGGI